jgi:hypothetical protein
MFSPGQGALRLARATGLALAAYTLSVVAHLAGGGHAPSALATAVLLFLTWWVCVMVTFRRLGRVACVALLAVSQVLLHGALSLASSAGGCVQVVHQHAGHLTNGTMTVCSAEAAPMHHHGSSLLMTSAHTVAAVLLGLVLARGEAALWFLAALVWPRPLVAPVLVTPARVWVAVVQTARTGVVVPGGVGRRGPPVGCAFAAA